MNTVDVTCYLIIGAKLKGEGANAHVTNAPTVRSSKSKPSLDAHEVPICLRLSLPVTLFQRPALEMKLVIPAETVPFDITPQVQSNIAKALRGVVGMEVKVSANSTP